jgi:GntR family transcriptional repressor for pyruvate dehydrogenase complex
LRFEAIVANPGYKRVADAIEQEILTGRLNAGDLLPTEAELAAQLGVNRSTLREGIRSLENAGLIRRTGGKRLAVCIPTHGDVAWSTSRALGLNKVTFLELWQVQMNLEPFAAALAAEHTSPALSEALERNIERMRDELDDDRAIIELDIAFHMLVAEGTRNRALVLSAKPIGMMLFSATLELYKLAPQARHRLLEAHRRIADAIQAGDAEVAREWMAKHIRDFRRGYDVAGMDLDRPIEFDPRTMSRS